MSDNGNLAKEEMDVIEEVEVPLFDICLDLDQYNTSIFEGKTMRERVDPKLVNGFIHRKLGIKYTDGSARYKKVALKFETELMQIKAYRKERWNPKSQRFETLFFLGKHGLGRINPSEHLSLCVFHRPTRHSLCECQYIDLDMVNAHPTLCAEVARMYSISCPVLDEYVADPKKFREELMAHYSVEKDTAKGLPIRDVYGGEERAWALEHGVHHRPPMKKMVAMHVELYKIRRLVVDKNPDILARILAAEPDYFTSRGKNGSSQSVRDRTIMSYWCLTVERHMQEKAILEFLRLCPGACLEDVVPCQDGFMILKELFNREILDSIYKKIEDDMGFRVKWADKLFDEPLPKAIVPVSCPGDRDMTEHDLMSQLIDDGLIDCLIGSNFNDVGRALKSGLPEDGLRLWQRCGLRQKTTNVQALEELWNDPNYFTGDWTLQIIKDKVAKKNKAQYNKIVKAVIEAALAKELKIKNQFDNAVPNLKNDLHAADRLLQLYPHWKNCNGDLYVFDDTTGMWTTSESVHIQMISRFAEDLRSKTLLDNVWVYDSKGWGDTTRKIKDLIVILRGRKCISDNGWLERDSSTGLKKLLFKNGYYDGEKSLFFPSLKIDEKTGKLVSGFDPAILFFGFVDHDYPTSEEIAAMIPLINSIKKRFFYDVFPKAVAERAIWRYSVAIFGEALKSIILNIGVTDSGKSTIAKGFQYSYGSGYVGVFNSESLTFNKNSSNDEAQRMRVFFLKRYCRLLFGSEISMQRSLDGAILKKLAGLDDLCGRLHGGNETTFRGHFATVIGVNDMPKIEPLDDAAVGRCGDCLLYTKPYVDEPKTGQLKKDPGLDAEMQTLSFKQAFVQLFIQAYASYIADKVVPPISTEMQETQSAYIGVKSDAILKFLEDYTLTNNKKDFVPTSEIEQWRADKKLLMTDAKWNMDLKQFVTAHHPGWLNVFGGKQTKVAGKNVRGWSGIKRVEPDYSTPAPEEDSDSADLKRQRTV